MAFYESVFIARQEISAQQTDMLADQFTGVIADNGGQVTKREYWGLKTLAYRIKKNRKGHYVMFNIDGPSSAVHEMERQMRLNEDILRILTVKVDELDEGPSPQMQSRSRDSRYDDGDRPRRDDRSGHDRNEGNDGGDEANSKADNANADGPTENKEVDTLSETNAVEESEPPEGEKS
ncbi:MAG: 30S ribosomal protein S6 [Pseudomonadota bacterium]|nr:30S ribosomal protein S6 [Pseudomonadota bacterium]